MKDSTGQHHSLRFRYKRGRQYATRRVSERRRREANCIGNVSSTAAGTGLQGIIHTAAAAAAENRARVTTWKNRPVR